MSVRRMIAIMGFESATNVKIDYSGGVTGAIRPGDMMVVNNLS